MAEILDLPARHQRSSPVFVIGAPRSGTSLLCSVIRRYLKINFGTESQFIVRLYRRVPLYGDLREPANLRRLIDDIGTERCFERWTRRFGFVLDTARVYETVLAGRRSYSEVLRAIFAQFARYHGMPRWGDKTPEYNYDLPVLLSLFPDAQFVHIVRDGRDVALSTLRMGFGGANVYRAAANWRRQLLLIDEFTSALGPEQAITIHYEQLLERPMETFGRLVDFLEIEEEPALMNAIERDLPGQLRSSNHGKWRTAMPAVQQRLFESVAGEQLTACGYEVSGPRAPLGPATRLYYDIDHVVRKTIKPQYWSDHLYRGRLRLGLARRAPQTYRYPSTQDARP